MRFLSLKRKAHSLFDEAGWLTHIENKTEYQTALRFMDTLIEDYDENIALIEVLASSIERWEKSNKDFTEFNQSIDGMDQGVSLVKILMEQYGLSNV